MTHTAFQGNPVLLSGNLPEEGAALPKFSLTSTDLSTLSNQTFAGRRVVFNIFPSVDTGVCAASVRRFNELATQLENTVVVNVSRDLPFALARFCATEGIENAQATSDFRQGFGNSFGVVQVDGPLAGLLARSVVVADENGVVVHSQLVPEIAQEPDYDAALAALG